MELEITVYDDDDNVVKKCKAQTVDIRFGQISAIMELVNIDEMDNSMELLKTVKKAWTQLTRILSKVFPDMEDEDWENVSVKELLPVVVIIIKDSIAEMLAIPKSKNV